MPSLLHFLRAALFLLRSAGRALIGEVRAAERDARYAAAPLRFATDWLVLFCAERSAAITISPSSITPDHLHRRTASFTTMLERRFDMRIQRKQRMKICACRLPLLLRTPLSLHYAI